MIQKIDRIKRWFYAIPIVARIRTIHSKIHAYSRTLGYFINWFVLHFWGAVIIASPFLLLALTPLPFWQAAAVGSVIAWLFYAASELYGWLGGGTSPWWDHLGDMIGPTILVIPVFIIAF